MTEIPFLDARALSHRLHQRTITATDALRAHQRQVNTREREVNAFVTLDWDAGFAQAAELDRQADAGAPLGVLHGIPIAIKDVFETKGLRTTWGSHSFATYTPDFDALHVARLRAAGAVIIGKTNTPEFAFSGQTSNLVSGTTRNPLNPTRTVAGSSGGAAAALAAHMVPLADGSDLGGSLRTPAAWCGVVGYRPTSGLVPHDPNPVPFDGLSVPGPMARNVADLTLMLSVMAGNDARQPLGFWQDVPQVSALDMPFPAGRLAFCAAPFGTSPHASILSALAPVPALCESLGWQVADAAPDLAPLHDFAHLTRGLSALGVRAALDPDMSLSGESFRTACASGDGLSLADFVAYQSVRARIWTETVAFFDRYDFALWPTATGLPFSADLGDREITEDWRTVTLTPVLELPSISIPFGKSSDGMPVGLHITGPKGSDARLLRFAHQIEQAIK
ncbi:amidase family protein [Aliisedimentitalea scapharcae]|uniref:Amidase family protein n=1 Tax=Aliisedimentitalea scapharcae TaxID=1524259 RepID=A0ABZ2XTW3_9RHOB